MILVTGGAGYIGSHIVKQLGELGREMVILDNLSTGHPDSILYGNFIQGDVGDINLVSNIIKQHQVQSVIHLAANTHVDESVAQPIKYYRNNTENTLKLLQACADNQVNDFIFSSTSAVYGNAKNAVINEDHDCHPLSPYGHSKLMSEDMIKDVAKAKPLRFVILRYFNVAGASLDGKIGNRNPTNVTLIHSAALAAVGKKPHLAIFGTQFNTGDGTCIRDYIHVDDIASAHIHALEYLAQGGQSVTLNCGYGHGYSVRQVVDKALSLAPNTFQVILSEPRAGDPVEVIADNARIKEVLKWTPKHDDLSMIIQSAIAWQQKLSEAKP